LFAGTQADNLADMTRKGRRSINERHGNTKISVEDVHRIRGAYQRRIVTQAMLAEQFGVSRQTIGGIVAGKQRKHCGGSL
jgi:DNA-binding XRE family transcriptional regulator